MATVTVQDCLLRVDSPIYYATREIGRLYETGNHLHNYALTYALGLAQSDYHIDYLSPMYQVDLLPVSERGVYVTPASPRRVSYMISSLNFGGEQSHESLKGEKGRTGNRPSYGRIREIAPGSEFSFRVISTSAPELPRWIRMGIWMSKCEVIVEASHTLHRRHGHYVYPDALNPLDIQQQPESFDIVPMPPNSLIRNVTLAGEWWIGEALRIPADMAYLRGYNGE